VYPATDESTISLHPKEQTNTVVIKALTADLSASFQLLKNQDMHLGQA
jgi:hypothetical protein